MQEKISNALATEAIEKAQLQPTQEKMFQASRDNNRGIYFPQYWKKKKLNPNFVKELEKAAASEPFAKDEFGEYRLGTFLHGCAVVKVEITDDLLSIAIHSEHPVGLPLAKEIRYRFAPNAYLMTMLMPSREQQVSDNTAVIYQIPGDFSEIGVDSAGEEGGE